MRQGPTMCLIAGHGYLVPADLQVVADMSRPDSVGELRRFSPGRFRLEEAPVMTPTPGDELMTVHGVGVPEHDLGAGDGSIAPQEITLGGYVRSACRRAAGRTKVTGRQDTAAQCAMRRTEQASRMLLLPSTPNSALGGQRAFAGTQAARPNVSTEREPASAGRRTRYGIVQWLEPRRPADPSRRLLSATPKATDLQCAQSSYRNPSFSVT